MMVWGVGVWDVGCGVYSIFTFWKCKITIFIMADKNIWQYLNTRINSMNLL